MNGDELGREIIVSAVATLRANKGWADQAIAQVSDEQLHTALDPNTNSIAVIMRHVAGNLRSRWTDFLTSDGEKPWRNRDEEFVGTLCSRTTLVDDWESGWNCLLSTLEGLAPADLARIVEIRGQPHSVPLALHRAMMHVAYHIGQIILVARILGGDSWTTITIPRGESASFNQRVWGPTNPATEAKPPAS